MGENIYGGKELKESQHYEDAFGFALLDVWHFGEALALDHLPIF